jgi:site-specific DNA recombinase
MARNGAFDVFVTREIDRLSRNLAKQLIVEAELKRAGVTIEYVLDEYPDTPEGRLNKHIKATIAEYEREKITERTTRARRLKVQAGSTMFNGNPPYGYKEIQLANGNWALEIVPEEARVVRLIFSWYVSGDGVGGSLTLAGITHRLTQMGIPTQIDSRGRANVKKRAVGTWARGTVWTMLCLFRQGGMEPAGGVRCAQRHEHDGPGAGEHRQR